MTSQNKRLAAFTKKIGIYRHNIAAFAQDQFGFEPDEWQDDVFAAIDTDDRVSVKSGQGVGKTASTAIIILWFLSCYPYSKVVATAPTVRQLNDVLWAEVEKWKNKSPVLKSIIKSTKTYLYMVGHEKQWFATARTATKPENIQGFHEDNLLIVVDEASGVADAIMEAILGTLSGSNNKLLMLSNPTKTSGVFYESHTKNRDMYRCFTVNSKKCARVNRQNIADLERKYGPDSNVVRVRVLGEFPESEDDVFIPLHLIERSIRANDDYKPDDKPLQIHIGCDVARFGGDKTVITYRIDDKVEISSKKNGRDTMKTADDILLLGNKLVRKYKLSRENGDIIPIKVDDSGVGGGVVDRLNQVKANNPETYWWIEVYPVHFGVKISHKYYDDTTSYMMSIVKNLLSPFDEDGKEKPIELILPDDVDLEAQLSCRKYTMTDKAKIRVESKDAMKARGLPSPDEADSVLLVCLPVKLPKQRHIHN